MMKKEEAKKGSHLLIEKLYFSLKGQKGKFIIYGALVILIVFFAFHKFSYLYLKPGDKNHALDCAFDDWEKQPTDNIKYEKLISLINKNPSSGIILEPKIVQRLIYENDPKFRHLAEELLSKSSLPSPYHGEFSNISLLIADKKYQEAYSSSIELKKRMEKEENTHLYVYKHNLIRLCMLAKQMKDTKKELEGLSELEKNIKEKDSSLITEIESKNQLNLSDYILHRRSALSENALNIPK
jgi:hypothetical protein